MTIKSRIPERFYRLFHSKYMDYYQIILISLYEESGQSYSVLGLTEEECCEIIEERIATFTMDWSQQQLEDEGELLTRSNMSSIMLRRLQEWGWLKKDYDEEINEYIISFPDYSQIFVDVFVHLYKEESSKERESILSLYSHLFTYSSDKEKNNEILRGALQMAKSLLQMLFNMQEGMRDYFEELATEKTFRGIQEVLINEMNNVDSKKYAILTTTDSFYRYKEEVRDLIEKNLWDNEIRKQSLIDQKGNLVPDSMVWYRNERRIRLCEESMELLFKLEREFNAIEKRYNKLIEQKRIFAKRAAARIRFIMTEGDSKEDQTKLLIQLLNQSKKEEEILQKLGEKMGLTQKPQMLKETSLLKPKEGRKKEFFPKGVEVGQDTSPNLQDFVVKPLYSQAEIQSFKKKNEENGIFLVTKNTVQDVFDLEKLLFVWQDATEILDDKMEIEVGEEVENEVGMKYTAFSIKEKKT